MSSGEVEEYPPPGHVLRRFALVVEPAAEGAVRLTFPVRDSLCHPLGGVRTGALVTAIDVAGGLLAARAVHPDWIATAGLSLDQARPAMEGEVEVWTRLLRAGRSIVALTHDVADERGPVGTGTMTFSRLARREGNPDVGDGGEERQTSDAGRVVFATEPDPGVALVDAVGLEISAGEASASLELTEVVRNSLGTVQGGMLGLVAEAAAEAAGSAVFDGPARTIDLALDYVAVAKTGPVRGVAEVVRTDPGRRSLRAKVTITDEGARRLAVIAHATVVPG